MLQRQALPLAGASAGSLNIVARLRHAEQSGGTSAIVSVYRTVLAGWSSATSAGPGIQQALLEQTLPSGDLLRLLMEHLSAPTLALCALPRSYLLCVCHVFVSMRQVSVDRTWGNLSLSCVCGHSPPSAAC